MQGGNFLLPPNRDGSVSPTPSRRERTPSVISAGRPAWVDVQMANRLKIPHTFVIHTYTKPTKCHFCNKMLVGVFKQVREPTWTISWCTYSSTISACSEQSAFCG